MSLDSLFDASAAARKKAVDGITIRRPDDWHVHLRDGEMLRTVAPWTSRQFARAIVGRPPRPERERRSKDDPGRRSGSPPPSPAAEPARGRRESRSTAANRAADVGGHAFGRSFRAHRHFRTNDHHRSPLRGGFLPHSRFERPRSNRPGAL